MDLFEYQARDLFESHQIPVLAGAVATTADQAYSAAEKIGGKVVVKAQVKVGGRGKAGGVKLAENAANAKEKAGAILGINIGPNKDSASRIDDYVECFKNFHNLCSYICINISSPNTENLRNFHEQENLKKLLSEILNTKKYLSSNTPVILKISPDINDGDIDMICKNILEFNLDGLVLTNTSVKLRENLVNKQKNEMGGVSGAPIKDTSNLIIKKFFKTLKAKVPIIGVGGINSGISAYEKIRAGASLLQLYTGLVYKGPFVVRAIKQELAELLRRDGFPSLQKAVGVDSE